MRIFVTFYTKPGRQYKVVAVWKGLSGHAPHGSVRDELTLIRLLTHPWVINDQALFRYGWRIPGFGIHRAGK